MATKQDITTTWTCEHCGHKVVSPDHPAACPGCGKDLWQLDMPGEKPSLIGSDKAHTKWCREIAMRCLIQAAKDLGPAARLFTVEIRRALFEARVLGVIAGQGNEELPIWRTQELIQIANEIFDRRERGE
jgi:hypothetical protein